MSQSQAASYDSSDNNHISQSLTIIVIVPNLHSFLLQELILYLSPSPLENKIDIL